MTATRLDERRFWADFEAIQSGILGALYSAVSEGLRNEATVVVEKMPRMADSARWIAACCPALGWDFEDWSEAYADKQQEAEDTALENDVVGMALWTWWKARSEKTWNGSDSDLRMELFCYAADEKSYPRQSNVFSGRLRRLLPVLRKKGIEVEKDKIHSGRTITVKKVTIRDDATIRDDQEKARSSRLNQVKQGIFDTVTMRDDLFSTFNQEEDKKTETIPKEHEQFPEKDRHASSRCVSSSKNQGLSVTISETAHRHASSPSVTLSSRHTTLRELTDGEIPLDHPCQIELLAPFGKARVTTTQVPWDQGESVSNEAWQQVRTSRRWLGGKTWVFWYNIRKPEDASLTLRSAFTEREAS